MARQYEMQISRMTVDKLGVKLYDRAYAVIAELVSNSYDADATKVTIRAPMGQYLAVKQDGVVTSKNITIEVEDNGVGMAPDELQNFYLVVGKERRKDPKRGG
ncbi:ATP-binding protein [Klebsiella michiganensis]|uniref:ATP-binding protein n=1 Tax=Klebsiella michiganensis TaxID=1134687 RepID=UPI001F1D2F15|nr:ATP-binding protein [Klebsiella michiganensis]UIU16658.1 ATP-binding protein [Klebsiella michiganensis]